MTKTITGAAAEAPVLVQREDYWARITVNRPRIMNAADMATWKSIGDEVARLSQDPGLRVLFITGTGERAFLAGADLNEFPRILQSRETIKEYIGTVSRACDQLEALDIPVIAEINGAAIGGGLELACACDYRIAVEGSKFGIPSADVGLGLAYADVARIVALAGTMRARELLIFGRTYDATEALAIGLVNEVVPREQLFTRSKELASSLAAKAPLSIRSAKKVLLSVAHPREPYYAEAVESIYAAWDSAEMRQRINKRLKRN
ncbi:MAG: enoyl-CoA hydratase/isomerase family protein [Betaproteobacteria bacterium]|nr:enoyl-CoA hydratase/isomerase family protein [Betaproteobacteria bacterium]